MGYLANLLIRIGADTKELNAGLDKATQSVRRFGTELQSAGQVLTLGLTVPLAGLGTAAVMAAGKMEQAQVSFTTLTKSADTARKHIEDMKRFALQTPFQFEDVTRASRLMQAYGFAIQDVIPKLRILGDTVSALGGGSDLLERVIRSVGEIGTRGKITGEQLRELARAGIPALEAVAQKLGVSVVEAQAKITAGQVDAKTAMEGLMEYMTRRFAGGMEAQSKTMLGLFSNVKDAITFTLSDLGDTLLPIGKKIVNEYIYPLLTGVRELASAFSKLPEPVQAGVLSLGAFAASAPLVTLVLGNLITNGIIVGQAIGKLMNVLSGLATTFTNALVPATNAGIASSVAFRASMAAIAVVITAETLKAVYDLISGYYKLRAAQDDQAKTQLDMEKSLNRLEVFLRQNGVDISAATKAYNSGAISITEYLQKLRDLAKEHGSLAGTQTGMVVTTESLGQAFRAFGVTSIAESTKHIKELEQQLLVIKQAQIEGKATTLDVMRAEAALAQARKALAAEPLDKFKGLPFAEMSFDAAILTARINETTEGYKNLASEIVRLRSNMPYGPQDPFAGFADAPEVAKKIYDLDAALRAWLQDAAATVEQTQELAQSMDAVNAALSKAAGDRRAEQNKKDISYIKDSVKDAKKEMSEFEREVHRAFDSMSRHLATNIVNWKGWKDSIIQVGKDLATGFLEILIRQLIKPLENAFASVVGKITGALFGGNGSGGGLLGAGTSILSGGFSSTTSQILNTAGLGGGIGATGGVAGGAGSAGGGVASAFGGGASAITGWAQLGVSIASGIFQGAMAVRQEGTLNAIEHNTRYLMIYTGEQADSVLETVHQIWASTNQIRDHLWGATTDYLRQLNDTVSWGVVKVQMDTPINIYLDSKKLWAGMATQAQLAGV